MSIVSVPISTAGVKVAYAVETSAGVMPKTGYTEIIEVTATPGFDEPPEILDVTPLSEPTQRRGIAALRPLPGTTAYTANFSQAFKNQWADIVDEYEAAKAAGRRMWFVTIIPDWDESFYVSVEPISLRLGEITVGTVLDIGANISPLLVHGWDAAASLSVTP